METENGQIPTKLSNTLWENQYFPCYWNILCQPNTLGLSCFSALLSYAIYKTRVHLLMNLHVGNGAHFVSVLLKNISPVCDSFPILLSEWSFWSSCQGEQSHFSTITPLSRLLVCWQYDYWIRDPSSSGEWIEQGSIHVTFVPGLSEEIKDELCARDKTKLGV